MLNIIRVDFSFDVGDCTVSKAWLWIRLTSKFYYLIYFLFCFLFKGYVFLWKFLFFKKNFVLFDLFVLLLRLLLIVGLLLRYLWSICPWNLWVKHKQITYVLIKLSDLLKLLTSLGHIVEEIHDVEWFLNRFFLLITLLFLI